MGGKKKQRKKGLCVGFVVGSSFSRCLVVESRFLWICGA